MRGHLVPACVPRYLVVTHITLTGLTQDVECDARVSQRDEIIIEAFLLHHLAPECQSFIRPAPGILPPSHFLTCGSLGSSSAHMPGSSELA